MGLWGKTPVPQKSPEQVAQEAEQLERQRRAEEKRRQAERFAKTPAGKAKAAYDAGATIYQLSLPLSETSAHVVPLAGAYTHKKDQAHDSILGSIEAQGWRLEHAGYVFRVTGSESRDKFLSSGQQEAVSGQIIGIYIFRRQEAKPGEQATD